MTCSTYQCWRAALKVKRVFWHIEISYSSVPLFVGQFSSHYNTKSAQGREIKAEMYLTAEDRMFGSMVTVDMTDRSLTQEVGSESCWKTV